jgi:hypothetical protein
MATQQQRKFGSLPIGKPKRNGRKLTDAELDAGMTVEQMQQHQRELKAAAAKRREKAT